MPLILLAVHVHRAFRAAPRGDVAKGALVGAARACHALDTDGPRHVALLFTRARRARLACTDAAPRRRFTDLVSAAVLLDAALDAAVDRDIAASRRARLTMLIREAGGARLRDEIAVGARAVVVRGTSRAGGCWRRKRIFIDVSAGVDALSRCQHDVAVACEGDCGKRRDQNGRDRRKSHGARPASSLASARA